MASNRNPPGPHSAVSEQSVRRTRKASGVTLAVCLSLWLHQAVLFVHQDVTRPVGDGSSNPGNLRGLGWHFIAGWLRATNFSRLDLGGGWRGPILRAESHSRQAQASGSRVETGHVQTGGKQGMSQNLQFGEFDGDEYEEISSEEVDRVVEALDRLIEGAQSENVKHILEEAASSIYYLVYEDEGDQAEDLEQAA